MRRALLDQAARLAIGGGISSVTVQAVADAAGVTKGGFLHHFPHKQALIDALFQEVLDSFGDELDRLIAADADRFGCFTRAYITSVFAVEGPGRWSSQAALWMLMLTDATLRALWSDWFNSRLGQHHETDGAGHLAIVRLATDGLWLADLTNIEVPERDWLLEQLVAGTRQPLG